MASDAPEAWQTSAAGPFLMVGEVAVWSLGEDRFRVQSPDDEQVVEGHDQAVHLAHELADTRLRSRAARTARTWT
jgi:hypothetical protein